jgi:hypothetical protein
MEFDGCRLTYTRLNHLRNRETFKVPNSSGTSDHPILQSGPMSQTAYVQVRFTLKDMDLNSITFKISFENKGMQIMEFKTLKDEKNISYKDFLPGKSSKMTLRDRISSFSSFTLKKKAAEQVKNVFVHAIKLCQSGN